MSKFAWVTLTTNDTYSLGALVLAHSLRRARTQHQLAVLVTPGVSVSMRDKLKSVYNVVQEVNIMDSRDSANLDLLARPELGITFTKLHCWRLIQFDKCVFLDSDTLVLQNCDELFEREEFSAAPDVSWPDCFNSGVFVYRPSQETFEKIIDYGIKNGSFDGGDQGLLNQFFSDWSTSDIKKRLPFLYNVTAYASYCYLPAFKQFRDKIKILHFAGKLKPWLIHYNSQSKTPSVPTDYAHATDLIEIWWNIFFDHVHQLLNDHMRYSIIAIEAWKNNYDIMALHLQDQHCEQEQHVTNLYYNLQYEFHHRHYTNKSIEFRDPWEDYYSKEETNAEILNNPTITEDNEKQEHKYEFEFGGGKHQEIVQRYGDFASEDNCRTVGLKSESEMPNEAKEDSATSAGLAGALSHLRLGEPRSPEQDAYEQLMRRQCWETGQVDYSGRDSFDNIWKKITQTLDSKPDTSEKTGSS